MSTVSALKKSGAPGGNRHTDTSTRMQGRKEWYHRKGFTEEAMITSSHRGGAGD